MWFFKRLALHIQFLVDRKLKRYNYTFHTYTEIQLMQTIHGNSYFRIKDYTTLASMEFDTDGSYHLITCSDPNYRGIFSDERLQITGMLHTLSA